MALLLNFSCLLRRRKWRTALCITDAALFCRSWHSWTSRSGFRIWWCCSTNLFCCNLLRNHLYSKHGFSFYFRIYVSKHIHTHVHACLCMYVHICMHTYMYINLYEKMKRILIYLLTLLCGIISLLHLEQILLVLVGYMWARITMYMSPIKLCCTL